MHYAPEVRAKYKFKQGVQKGFKRKVVGFIDQFFDSPRWFELLEMFKKDPPIVFFIMKNDKPGTIQNIIIRRLKDFSDMPKKDVKDLAPIKPPPDPEEVQAEKEAMEAVKLMEQQMQERTRQAIEEDVELKEGMEIILIGNEIVTVAEINDEDHSLLVRFSSGREQEILESDIKGVYDPSLLR